MKDGVIAKVECIEVERNLRVDVGMMWERWMRPWLVQRVLGQSDIRIWVVGYHDTVYSRYLGGKLSGPLSRLLGKLVNTVSPKTPECGMCDIPCVRLCSFCVSSAERSQTHGSFVELVVVMALRPGESSEAAGLASLSLS